VQISVAAQAQNRQTKQEVGRGCLFHVGKFTGANIVNCLKVTPKSADFGCKAHSFVPKSGFC